MLKRFLALLMVLVVTIVCFGCAATPAAEQPATPAGEVPAEPQAPVEEEVPVEPEGPIEEPPTIKESNRVVIYHCLSTTRSDPILAMLQTKFPDYEIVLEYMGLSELAAKLENEGVDTDIDIALDLGYVYLEKMAQQNMFIDHRIFADIMQEQFEELFWSDDGSYMPWGPYSGCVAVNMDVLTAKGMTVPASWEDLLDPQYVDMIEMPNPASSGTGYIFYLMLAHHMGDEAAVEYFTKLSNNILEFTSSGSAPLKALVSGEVGIALCMTYQVALQMDEGVNLKILSLDGGYPWTSDGAAIIKGHNTAAVKEVFQYLYSDEVLLADAQLMPEHGLAGVATTIENWPADLTYAEMGEDTLAEKERLLALWPF